MNMKFTLKSQCGEARLGTIGLPHGELQTPVFMPVGTYGSVKAMLPCDIKDIGFNIILGNTFHLMLRPGTTVIQEHQSLHNFMGWQGNILTDSGGFQVFSLGKLRKISEQGVEFRSPIDGSKVWLDPERSMQVQRELGSDIVMIFDECTPHPATYQQAETSMQLSLRWAKRCKVAHENNTAALFGIVQGGMFEELRQQSLEGLCDIGFDGYAIGGLSVGESKQDMQRILQHTTPRLPKDKPRYLMGVGTPLDIVQSVMQGVDMFDCVMPTRNARNGCLFTSTGVIRIKNSQYQHDTTAIDAACLCYACKNFSRAYMHHLFKANEIVFSQLATLHNLNYYARLMQDIRQAILDKTLPSLYNRLDNTFDT